MRWRGSGRPRGRQMARSLADPARSLADPAQPSPIRKQPSSARLDCGAGRAPVAVWFLPNTHRVSAVRRRGSTPRVSRMAILSWIALTPRRSNTSVASGLGRPPERNLGGDRARAAHRKRDTQLSTRSMRNKEELPGREATALGRWQLWPCLLYTYDAADE